MMMLLRAAWSKRTPTTDNPAATTREKNKRNSSSNKLLGRSSSSLLVLAAATISSPSTFLPSPVGATTTTSSSSSSAATDNMMMMMMMEPVVADDEPSGGSSSTTGNFFLYHGSSSSSSSGNTRRSNNNSSSDSMIKKKKTSTGRSGGRHQQQRRVRGSTSAAGAGGPDESESTTSIPSSRSLEERRELGGLLTGGPEGRSSFYQIRGGASKGGMNKIGKSGGEYCKGDGNDKVKEPNYNSNDNVIYLSSIQDVCGATLDQFKQYVLVANVNCGDNGGPTVSGNASLDGQGFTISFNGSGLSVNGITIVAKDGENVLVENINVKGFSGNNFAVDGSENGEVTIGSSTSENSGNAGIAITGNSGPDATVNILEFEAKDSGTQGIFSGGTFNFGQLNILKATVKDSNDQGILISGDSPVIIQNADISGSGASGTPNSGIRIGANSSANVIVLNSKIYENSAHGIFTTGTGSLVVQGGTIRKNEVNGIRIAGQPSRATTDIIGVDISENGSDGVLVNGDNPMSDVNILGSTIDKNKGNGVTINSSNANVKIKCSGIDKNGSVGVNAIDAGSLVIEDSSVLSSGIDNLGIGSNVSGDAVTLLKSQFCNSELKDIRDQRTGAGNSLDNADLKSSTCDSLVGTGAADCGFSCDEFCIGVPSYCSAYVPECLN